MNFQFCQTYWILYVPQAHFYFFATWYNRKDEKKRGKPARKCLKPDACEHHGYLLQLNIHLQVYCDIKWKLHLHMHITVVWHLSYPLSTHTQTHSLTHLHTHSAPWGRLWGRCSESKVKQWGCKTEKRVERLTPLFPSRPARPIFKMLMPGAQTHSVQFIWSFSRKTLWSLKQLNWQLKEYWDAPKQTQYIATLNLCGTHTSVSVSFYLCLFEE